MPNKTTSKHVGQLGPSEGEYTSFTETVCRLQMKRMKVLVENRAKY